jgi:hypothetical protein
MEKKPSLKKSGTRKLDIWTDILGFACKMNDNRYGLESTSPTSIPVILLMIALFTKTVNSLAMVLKFCGTLFCTPFSHSFYMRNSKYPPICPVS